MKALTSFLVLDDMARQAGCGLKPALRQAIEAQLDRGSLAPDRADPPDAAPVSSPDNAPAAPPAPDSGAAAEPKERTPA